MCHDPALEKSIRGQEDTSKHIDLKTAIANTFHDDITNDYDRRQFTIRYAN